MYPALRGSVLLQARLLLVALFLLAVPVSQARDLPDFTQLVERYGPAVVNISSTQKVERKALPTPPPNMPMPPEGTPWDDFFRRFFGQPEEGDTPENHSLGSGFIIDAPNGLILTNNHVVEGADEIVVRLSDRRELVAELVGADKRSDIALLKVKATDLPVVKIGSTDDLKVGEWVMAIGTPFGFDHSVSVGVVSALGRSLPSESYVPFIQTDVAINPGNSGGPLFNLDGKVVGINSQIYSRTGGFMGLSFAIPIDVAMDVVGQLKSKGFVTRGWLGVRIQDVTRELAESFGMERPSGALVAQVIEGSPGAKAGLQVGDLITEFNGQKIDYSSELPPLVGRTPIGQEAKLKVLRDGKMRIVPVRIGELPKEEEIASTEAGPRKSMENRVGIAVADLTAEQRSQLGLGKFGVVVTEVAPGPGAEAGIRRGDVLLKINGTDIENVAHFRKLVKQLPAGKASHVLVQRRSGSLFLALKIPKDK